MVFFLGVVGITLILLIFTIRGINEKNQRETKVRDKTLQFLKGKGDISIIDLIEHVNIMPDQMLDNVRKMENADLISEKNGKVKITKFGEKAYENILKGE